MLVGYKQLNILIVKLIVKLFRVLVKDKGEMNNLKSRKKRKIKENEK